MNFHEALQIANGVLAQYKVDQPRWWKRMDGTPILNDVAVLMATAFSGASAATVAEPSDEATSYKRMFEDAVSSLGTVDAALGIDPDEAGGAAPILEAIAALKKQAAVAVAALPEELKGIPEAIQEGGGIWSTCTGCYESEDGHPVGRYPHSDVLGCALGGGCSECGGIGAVWDTTDYAAMADAGWAQMQSEQAAQQQAEPVAGEEIHVNVSGGDVYTLPLQASGMDKPRFVVHVPVSNEVAAQRRDEQAAFRAYNPLGYKMMEGQSVWQAACAWQRSQQAEPVGDEREAAESAYNSPEFNYERGPIGSHDWRFYSAGWRARATRAAKSGQRAGDALGWESRDGATFTLEDAAIAGQTHTAKAYAAASSALARLHEICIRHGCGDEVMHEWLERVLSGQRAGVAEGYVLVPVAPTKPMLDAAERLNWASDDVRGNCCNLWNAMLAAAPTPAAQGGDSHE
jgi:hypothetical protein